MDGHALGTEPLREVTVVAHDDDGSTRRWFTSSSMDLFVWLDPAGRVVAVQLAWGKPADEHLASWDARWPDRWTYGRIDDGEGPGLGHKATPVLATGGELDAAALRAAFEAAAASIPDEIREDVLRRLGESA